MHTEIIDDRVMSPITREYPAAAATIASFSCLPMQLCQRPLNGDLKKPNYNNDYIAPMFRNYLMPARQGPTSSNTRSCLAWHTVKHSCGKMTSRCC